MNGVAHTIMGAYIGSMAISSMQPKIPQAALIMGASVLGEIFPDIENVHSIVGRAGSDYIQLFKLYIWTSWLFTFAIIFDSAMVWISKISVF